MKPEVKQPRWRWMLSRGASLTLIAASFITVAVEARSETDPFAEQEPADRWVPALSIGTGVVVQGAEATASSDVRPEAAGDDMMVTPFLGFHVELMAPALDILGQPRPFASVGVLPNWGPDRDVAKEGDPGEFRLPDPPQPRVGEAEITGQGSATRVKWNREIVTASVGVAFELDIFERPALIKPSVEWINYTLQIQGRAHRVYKPDPFDPTARYVTINGSEDMDVNAIGPGLELEIDAGRVGPLGLSVFVGGQAYRILGNDDEQFKAIFDDGVTMPAAGFGPPAPLEGNFSVEVDPWLFRGGVGFRMKWLPL